MGSEVNFGKYKSPYSKDWTSKDKSRTYYTPYVESETSKQGRLDKELATNEGWKKKFQDSTRAELESQGAATGGYRGDATLNAIAGARERGARDVTTASINALRVSLGLPAMGEV